ncbi:hypothetical protein D4R42_00885 [bacterium]|nr:MAG: hypothetical protein D4R42_00885 [bacterium]
MTINPGDLVYIEALTGTSKNKGNWFIKGIYEVAETSELKIYLIEGELRLGIYKSRIQKIEKRIVNFVV